MYAHADRQGRHAFVSSVVFRLQRLHFVTSRGLDICSEEFRRILLSRGLSQCLLSVKRCFLISLKSQSFSTMIISLFTRNKDVSIMQEVRYLNLIFNGRKKIADKH